MKNIFAISCLLLCSLLMVQCSNSGSSGPLKTVSGYEYYKVHDANGKKPVKGDFVYFEMDIKKPDGTVINSMRNRPEPPSVQIPLERDPSAQNALIDMLAMGSVGDTLKLILPIDSMPGAKAQFPDVTHFEYEANILEVLSKNAYAEKLAGKQEESRLATEGVSSGLIATLANYKSGKIKDLVKLPSGLEYVVHEEGSGDVVPVGEKITANYYGVVKSTGARFDDSFSKGRPFSFTLGRGEVIRGWDEGMGKLKQGSKATLFIPYDMAYGENGRPPSIPAKSDLVFYVEIL